MIRELSAAELAKMLISTNKCERHLRVQAGIKSMANMIKTADAYRTSKTSSVGILPPGCTSFATAMSDVMGLRTIITVLMNVLVVHCEASQLAAAGATAAAKGAVEVHASSLRRVR